MLLKFILEVFFETNKEEEKLIIFLRKFDMRYKDIRHLTGKNNSAIYRILKKNGLVSDR